MQTRADDFRTNRVSFFRFEFAIGVELKMGGLDIHQQCITEHHGFRWKKPEDTAEPEQGEVGE
jgi:hypothetical protein